MARENESNERATKLNLMSFNIRHDHHKDSPTSPFAAPPVRDDAFNVSLFGEEQPWSIRKWKVMDTILLYSPDVLALQEPVYHQILDLEALLADEYEWVGAGRNDGDKQGEFSAVFYKREILTVESWKTLWLSEEPDTAGSKGWDAKHPRTATQVTFIRNSDDTKFSIFNAHLDHKGLVAREEASRLVLERARSANELGPVFLLGDLNSTESDPAYLILTGSKYENTKGSNDTLANLDRLNDTCASAFTNKTGMPTSTKEGSITLPTHRVIRPGQILANLKRQKELEEEDVEKYFLDTQYELITRVDSKGAAGTLSGPYGYRDTFTSFGSGDEYKRAPIRIDFIMALQSNQVKVKVLYVAVLSNQFDDGLIISDHRPVIAKVSW
ncbi:Endonuclease/exonuclease/phosphatase [Helicostylum pulchrum]|uniref:Endonuclease/exonuclease/phosphatase domain-containing protein n=1 Tax=Helicostylum pulchrum TaxID=562976 RepID=A0ABP9YFG9_9FUNG|nr:Endonuclease/exonuclease/phosphatase [Helicostylum pulchrum]